MNTDGKWRRMRTRPISWNLILFLMTAAAVLTAVSRSLPLPSAMSVADAATSEPGNSSAPADPLAAAGHPVESSVGSGEKAEHSGGHADPVAQVLLGITIILFAAKLAGELFERIGMPGVLGELTVGIVLGNWLLFTGMPTFAFLKPDPENAHALTGNVLDILARIGVVLLLFEVGLETRIRDMVSVGISSFAVAVLGVVAPMLLGFGVGYFLLSESLADWQVPVFLGATLCATSVGITARVLKDLGRGQDRESKIILGAAVIDDVLGLIVLAVVSGIIREGANFQISSLLQTVAWSFGFLAAALVLGAVQLPRLLFRGASVLRGQGMLVITALVICFMFSWAANQVALAPIIGAFAAGLILEGTHYRDVGDKWRNHHLEEALAPISTLMVPIFFVAMGMSVDLRAFTDPSVWMLAGGLTTVAVIGKLACCFGVFEKGLNRLAVGLGMIPRGEVGLIFAAEGSKLLGTDGQPVVGSAAFSAIVVMVMVTTMVTPPLLKWGMSARATSTE